jgi:hypothetical protein
MYYAQLHEGPVTTPRPFISEADAVHHYWRLYGTNLRSVYYTDSLNADSPNTTEVWNDTLLT